MMELKRGNSGLGERREEVDFLKKCTIEDLCIFLDLLFHKRGKRVCCTKCSGDTAHPCYDWMLMLPAKE